MCSSAPQSKIAIDFLLLNQLFLCLICGRITRCTCIIGDEAGEFYWNNTCILKRYLYYFSPYLCNANYKNEWCFHTILTWSWRTISQPNNLLLGFSQKRSHMSKNNRKKNKNKLHWSCMFRTSILVSFREEKKFVTGYQSLISLFGLIVLCCLSTIDYKNCSRCTLGPPVTSSALFRATSWSAIFNCCWSWLTIVVILFLSIPTVGSNNSKMRCWKVFAYIVS